MEGLEISEILNSELELSKRIDSEYYKKYYLKLEDIVLKDKYCLLKEISDFLIGPFGSAFKTENYIEKGYYRYIRGQDVKPFVLKNSENRYVPFCDFQRLKKYALKDKDILISVVGTLGNACIVQKGDLPGIFSCKSTVIRTKKFNPVFVLTYLNCKYGKELLLRKERGAIQKGLNLDDLKTIIIPIFCDKFQSNIETIFYTAQKKIETHSALYQTAEAILLTTLGIQDFTPSQDKVNVKSFKESFLTTGRLDAEYYQKKYEDYYQLITSKSFTYIKDEYIHIKTPSKKEKKGYYYIEIGDVNVSDGNCNPNYINTEDLPANAKTIVEKGDIIISNVRPYRGAVSIINSEEKDIIVSGAFTVLRKSNNSIFNNEVLKVLLRSSIYKDWLLQFNVGTSYPVIKDDDVLNLPIPYIETQTQQEIAALIEESYNLKKQSEDLLELAKRVVEVAIEEGEEAGLRLINEFGVN